MPPPLTKSRHGFQIASDVRHPFESGGTFNVVRAFPERGRHANAGFCPTDKAGLIRGTLKMRAISVGQNGVHNEGEDVSRMRL